MRNESKEEIRWPVELKEKDNEDEMTFDKLMEFVYDLEKEEEMTKKTENKKIDETIKNVFHEMDIKRKAPKNVFHEMDIKALADKNAGKTV